jgi:flagellar FliL protein
MSEEAKAAPAKGKSRLKLLLMMVAVVVLLATGGAGAFWWMSRGTPAAAAAPGAHPEPAHEETGTAVSLPTFTVNLADKDSSRYLRTTLALVLPDADAAEEFTNPEHMGGNVKLMKARSAILELLSTQTADQLGSAEGKEALKKAIAQRASKAFGTKVTDVLFSEFVVQY